MFEAAGIEIVNISCCQDQIANAVAERWVQSVREECLEHLIILNGHHLRRVLTEYVAYYNTRRPHQGLDHDGPFGLEFGSAEGSIRCRPVLRGILHDYYRQAA